MFSLLAEVIGLFAFTLFAIQAEYCRYIAS